MFHDKLDETNSHMLLFACSAVDNSEFFSDQYLIGILSCQ